MDGIHPDKNALEFACYLGNLTHSKVTGVFLENLLAEDLTGPGGKLAEAGSSQLTKRAGGPSPLEEKEVELNINMFKDSCCERGILASVHRDRGVPAREIVRESRFADLVVIDAETSFNKRYEGAPTEFVRDVLKDAECPVVISPEEFEGVDEVVFAYDGGKASVFAIKQFIYLFPELSDRKLTIVQVNANEKEGEVNSYKFREWLKGHFKDIHFETLNGSEDDELFKYLFKKRNIFVVMGAYGRSEIARWFKRSHADRLIKTAITPIFIAHA